MEQEATDHDATEQNHDATEAELRAWNEARNRELARGCLLFGVFELAAILAAVLWVVARALELPALQRAGEFGFFAFTIVGVVLVLYITFVGRQSKTKSDESSRED